MAKCRGCGAKVIWVESKNLKKMILDAEPVKMIQVKEGIGEVVDVYKSHWGTCPKAAQFKRKK